MFFFCENENVLNFFSCDVCVFVKSRGCHGKTEKKMFKDFFQVSSDKIFT